MMARTYRNIRFVLELVILDFWLNRANGQFSIHVAIGLMTYNSTTEFAYNRIYAWKFVVFLLGFVVEVVLIFMIQLNVFYLWISSLLFHLSYVTVQSFHGIEMIIYVVVHVFDSWMWNALSSWNKRYMDCVRFI